MQLVVSWPPAATPFLGRGWGTRFAFGSGRLLMGPAGLEAWQPSWSSTPSLGAWPYLWGASPPTYRCTKASSVDEGVWVSGVSEIRPAGLGLTCALEAGVGRDPRSVINKVFVGVLPYADPLPLWLMFVQTFQAKALTQPRLEPSLSTDGRLKQENLSVLSLLLFLTDSGLTFTEKFATTSTCVSCSEPGDAAWRAVRTYFTKKPT